MTEPKDLARAVALVGELWAEFMTPTPRMSVWEWAEKNRFLSGKDSSEPGFYRVSRTPYAKEPQEALSTHSDAFRIICKWGAQTGKTSLGMNWIGSLVELQPGPVMMVQPTLDLAKRFSRQRLSPMIEDSVSLKRLVKTNRSRDDANTILLKEFAGGFLAIAGANSAAGLRSMPVRHIFADEVDAYPSDVDGEGDPLSLAAARQTTFSNSKTLITSTPLIADISRVDLEFNASNQKYFHVPCPHCNEFQTLELGDGTGAGLNWPKDEADNPVFTKTHYVCVTGCVIEEHHKTTMLAGGRWIAHNQGAQPGVEGYHLNSLYSPLGWLSWAQLAREFVDAVSAKRLGDHTKLRAFTNTRLAKTYKVEGLGADANALAARAEPYPLGEVPRGGLLLVMGVDTQADRLEARLWAYGRGEESWLIQRFIFYGDPNIAEGEEGSPWTKLTEVMRTPVLHAASRVPMPIEATLIDSGGANTHAVYRYCGTHEREGVLAAKGASQEGRAILGKPTLQDVSWRGATMKRGVKLWPIGTDTAKHLLTSRLRFTVAGPGYIHVPEAFKNSDEFEQMTAERLMPVIRNGKRKAVWVNPPGKRNEATDCHVYAYAAACWRGIASMTEKSWDKREKKYDIEPLKTEKPAAPVTSPAPRAEPQAPKAQTQKPNRPINRLQRPQHAKPSAW